MVPSDGQNLNRSSPGLPGGTDAEVLAHRVFETVVVGSDRLIDLHAGDLPESLEPFASVEEPQGEAASRKMALAYGLGHVVPQTRAVRTVAGSSCVPRQPTSACR